jgi:peptidoglycan/xylan/chitin deacetylase (PgdA/CDA1 family)
VSPPALVVSLDFELRWGVRDLRNWHRYIPNLLGARRAVPALLRLFERYRVHVTWAAVGFLFARDKDELRVHLPAERPTYDDPRLSPYGEIESIGADETDDPLSYAPSLLDRIAQTPGQEIATHTFSHYYCLEPGQTEAQLRADLRAAASIGKRYESVCASLVLPRNQHNPAYDRALTDAGVVAYRSPPRHWAYRPRPLRQDSLFSRAARLLDAYVPLRPTPETPWEACGGRRPLPIPAGAFLRPVSRFSSALEAVRLQRILSDLEVAARRGSVYHLWWHPHNFGLNLEANLAFLDAILTRFSRLRDEYGMHSLNMREIAERLSRPVQAPACSAKGS